MGDTLSPPMTVAQARRRLQDTSRLSAELIEEAQRIVTAFHDARPKRGQQCVACGGAVWSEHETGTGDASWACSGCHRSSTLTAEAWHAQRAERAAKDAEAQVRIAATEPKPRDALQAALARRTEAAAALARLEAAHPAARAALAAAQARHDSATADMQAAEQTAVQRAAAGLTGGRVEKAEPIDAARGRLRSAEDALHTARGAKGLVDDQLHYAKPNLVNAEAAVRRAALSVLSAEALEDLIEAASIARADYVEAIGGLGWLIRNGAIPNGDIRPNQLVREGDTPPSTWREAQNADGGLGERLNALLGGAP